MVRIDVTSNVTLTHTTWSHGRMRPAHKAHPIEYASVDSTSACVWTWMTRSGGADLLSDPGARWRARCPPGRRSRSPGGCEPPDALRVAEREDVRPRTVLTNPSGDTVEPRLDAVAPLIRFG
jgi:hypothetical protein